MPQTATINPRIVEGLYTEAMVLADEVRAAFDLSGRLEATGVADDVSRIAISCEALRTTTRMMQAIAWLLNHRAYLAGELSDFQLRRYGRLAPDHPGTEPSRTALLEPRLQDLIADTERFYARLLRLDRSWRERVPGMPGALDRLRERIAARTVAG